MEHHNINKQFIEFATKNIQKNKTLLQLIEGNEDHIKLSKKKNIKKEYRNIRNKKDPLKPFKNAQAQYEGGIDEAGRGPLFGRVYVACVILPKSEDEFNFTLMKDSKRFSSKKKLLEAYNYIIDNCIDYSICYKDEKEVDCLNIREATLQTMHECISNIKTRPDYLIVDGCDFRKYEDIPHECVEGGDNWYCSIAAASILAKVARDTYIEELCKENPELDEYYALSKNKGYGTKAHLDGLKKHGLSQWHRKTFGICKTL